MSLNPPARQKRAKKKKKEGRGVWKREKEEMK